MTDYALGSPENYTIGGIRLLFNELLNGAYQGFNYLGNIVTGGFTNDLTFLDHFSAQSGTRSKDRSVLQEISSSINVTLDEPNVDGVRYFLMGGDISATTVAAATVVTNEVMVLSSRAPTYLQHPHGVAAIVVKDSTLATTYVLNTDYTVDTFLNFSRIKRVGAGAITEGQSVRVSYTYDRRASYDFKPVTRTERVGKLLLQAVSDTGNEFAWEIAKASLKPDGDFSYNAEDWSQFSFVIDVLDNSAAVSTEPYGVLRHYGTGQNL